MRDLDISEVAKLSGVPASTLRYYEERGLIVSIGRRGLRRLFDPGVLDQLALIALGRASGFSLEEIGETFGADGRPQIDREKLIAKADELDAAILRLTAMRDGLRHAAKCSAPSHMECPKFIRLLRAVARGLIRAPEAGGSSAKRRARHPQEPPQGAASKTHRARATG